ncbi:hypothetical protein GEMRC1_003866 [Eukaryota sp. GEM-RC1]
MMFHTLCSFVASTLMSLGLSSECSNFLFVHLSFEDFHCLKELFLLGLSLGIIVFSSVLKIPQIVKLFKQGSAKELSLLSVVLDIVCYTIGISYSLFKTLPFAAFGESIPLILQSLIIFLLVLWFEYQTAVPTIIALLAGVSLTQLILFSGIIGEHIVLLQKCVILFGIVSRIVQLRKLFKSRTALSISLLSVFFMFFGNFIRFITLLSTKDSLIIASSGTGVILNGMIFFTSFHFSKNKIE